MSLIQADFLSETLHMYVGVNVILPVPRDPNAPLNNLPVLYLLHGMSDDFTAWQRKTAVERYALENNLAVVMPNGGMSCWENMAHGGAYRDFICDELPRRIRAWFPISADRDRNFIAGCSMGGLGAFRIGLDQPEAYSVIGAFSSPHFEYRCEAPANAAMLERVYGGDIDPHDAEIEANARAVAGGALPVRVFQTCGDRDLLYDEIHASRDFLASLGGSLTLRFETLPGRHDWALWDEALRRFIEFLDLPKPAGRVF